ncbi:hypothetical protein GF361_00845 [Candidatus Woesearchaeota archaeon]|nr:hypothetical protein [Candidatus Woesearchaeota archaeon]
MIKKSYLLNRLTPILILILVSGCGMSGKVAEQNIEFVVHDKGEIEDIYFCPGDNCSKAFSEFLLSAEESLHCAIYDLDLEGAIGILEEKSKKIDIKLIVDTDNYEYVEGLDFVLGDNRSSIMHNKFCIVDNKRIITGSMNPTVNGAERNNNNLIILKSKRLAENYEDEFDEMWEGEFGKGDRTRMPVVYINKTKVENYFCPEDSCGEKIERALGEAEESIYFMLFSFTHTGIANEMVMRIFNDVEVKGVFEKRGAGSEYSRYKLLEYQGAEVRKDSNGGAMHHKVFIIDNKTVITGSFNPSKNADTRNDENILIIKNKETAEIYLEEFKNIWENYSETE